MCQFTQIYLICNISFLSATYVIKTYIQYITTKLISVMATACKIGIWILKNTGASKEILNMLYEKTDTNIPPNITAGINGIEKYKQTCFFKIFITSLSIIPKVRSIP